ncbi:MLX-interacting protein-like isoform X1 [Haliotis rubra]|uniref:MLX-interacting protein-like isoform X1 n=1 Tax=Haliotis rubra TaxID=36100 RepID=UPI001EE5DC3D|nr:MLX-interacting protein-like isoform X1 [Haliotis rubra]
MRSVSGFATHLSFFDEEILFDVEHEENHQPGQGPIPPSVVCPPSKGPVGDAAQVKVKRKCGRPRNPIPRHKRESHINAEHRRRGKIQNGFQTLKNIVPKNGETSVGRDSKSDILFKAAEHSRKVKAECEEQKTMITALRQEMDILNAEIEAYQAFMPDGNLFEPPQVNMEERLSEYIQSRTRDSWKFWIFSFISRPLFESYNRLVSTTTTEGFLRSVMDWAASNLSLANLRSVVLGSLRSISTQTSIMNEPLSLPQEALHQTTGLSLDPAFLQSTVELLDKDFSLSDPLFKDLALPEPTYTAL